MSVRDILRVPRERERQREREREERERKKKKEEGRESGDYAVFQKERGRERE